LENWFSVNFVVGEFDRFKKGFMLLVNFGIKFDRFENRFSVSFDVECRRISDVTGKGDRQSPTAYLQKDKIDY
jgi:hypothetical protein